MRKKFPKRHKAFNVGGDILKKEKNRTPDKEGAKQPSPKEAISEALKECLDDLTSCDTDGAGQFVN